MNHIQVVFLIVSCYINGVVLYATGSSSSLPDFIKPCKGTDPNLNDCATKTANEVIPHLIDGYPSMNIPKMNPLTIPEILVEYPNFKLKMIDVDVHNLITGKVINSNYDLKNHNITITLNAKDLKFKGNYEMSGNLMNLPLNGKGPFELIANNGDYTVTLTYTLYEKKGVQFAKIEKVDAVLDIENVFFHFENLLSSHKEVSDNVNKVLNENWRECFKEMEPAVTQTLCAIVEQVLNGILDKVSYMDLWDNEHP